MPNLNDLSAEQRLSVTCSVPKELVHHYIRYYGQDLTEQMLPAFLGGRPLYIRVNTLKTDAPSLIAALSQEGVEASPTDFPHTLRLSAHQNPAHTKAYQDGLFHVQDPASGYACAALQAQAGMRVLDVCAAPGGKSFTVAQMMGNQGELLSCDLYDHKIALMEQGAHRLGITVMQPTLRDANAQDDIGEFDRILCDLPCSGLGVIGKKRDIKYRASREGILSLQTLQRQILKSAVRYLKTGGVMIYSTCTISKEENEENVKRFLAEMPFAAEDITPYLPKELENTSAKKGYLQLLPGKDPCDGFFIARMRRKSPA